MFKFTRDRAEGKYFSSIDFESRCWMWTASLTHDGYGRFSGGEALCGSTMAHRFGWWLRNGPIESGLELDHICRTRACQNIYHLRVVTTRENVLASDNRAAVNARKTRAVCGHDFDEVVWGYRSCRACRKKKDIARGQAYRADKKLRKHEQAQDIHDKITQERRLLVEGDG